MGEPAPAKTQPDAPGLVPFVPLPCLGGAGDNDNRRAGARDGPRRGVLLHDDSVQLVTGDDG
jgi:hypothetical protein